MRSFFLTGLLLVSASIFGGCSFDLSSERVDSFAQPVVPPPTPCTSDVLVTRTQGFWQNHSCVVKGDATGYSLVPVTLGASLVLDKPADVYDYLDQPTQGDTQIILGHQLLAAKLNVAAFGIGDFAFADWDGDGLKETVDELTYLADGLFDTGSGNDRTKMATILDKLNNAGDNEDLWFDPNCNDPPDSCD